MNRWLWPGAVVAAVAAGALTATLVGPAPVPLAPSAVTASRVSLVCPAFESVTARVRVGVSASGPGLRTSLVSEPNQGSDAGAFKVLIPGQAVRVSAPLPDPFGAVSVVASGSGPERGFAATGCVVPRTDHWFTGVDVRSRAQSEVVVSNLDGTEASIDLTVYGEQGRIAAPRGVEVAGNSTETVSLGVLARDDEPLTVRVSSTDGRVAAFLRQRTWVQDVALGVDWLPDAGAPATDLVVPGIPAGEGERRLVLTNPGERTSTVALEVLSESGPIELAGVEQVEVPAGTTRTVDLARGLSGAAAALRLTSTQPVTAGMWLDGGGNDERRDPAFTAASAPLPGAGVWPFAGGKAARTVLQLVNPAEAEASASLSTAAGSGAAGEPKLVKVPGLSTVTVTLPAAAANVLRIETASADLRGTLISNRKLGKVAGLALVHLAGQDGRGAPAQVVFDPHAGS